MKKFLIDLLDWVYKKKCYFCRSSKEALKMCSECFDEMEFLQAGVNRILDGVNIYCAGVYENNLQKLIRGIKYHNQKDLAYFQAKFMYDYWVKLEINKDFQVVPVPLYKTRQKQRKYNHMELVAEEFCKLTGYSTNFELFERIKDTKPQYKLKRDERMQNLENAFKLNKDKLQNKTVLLFDDICTTGSTFENMITELKKLDVSDIVCFATATPF